MGSTTAFVRRLLRLLAARQATISTAESCTGGLIAKLITDIPGSSAVFCGACVTYTNDIKELLLGVDPAIIARDTEVSAACAAAMAQGVREKLGTTVGISTTGYAGPGGGTEQEPVGTVYIAVSTEKGTVCERMTAPSHFSRAQVRAMAANRAVEYAWQVLNGTDTDVE